MVSIQNPDYDYEINAVNERTGLLSNEFIRGNEKGRSRSINELSEHPSDELDEPVIDQTRIGTSWYASVFLVVNAALGAGLLAFPRAYHEAGGVAIGIGIQALFLVFVVMALLVLAYCSDIDNSPTYQDVVMSMCGRAIRNASSLCLVTYCFGTCITFLIIIGDQWEAFFLCVNKDLYCSEHPWYMSRSFSIGLTSVLFILPLSFPKRIDFLKYASAVGVVAILYVSILIFFKYFLPHLPPEGIRTSPENWMDVFTVIPVICFGYQCHVSVIPIYSCMRKRNIHEFSKVAGSAIFICVMFYTVTATFGYLTFGADIASDVLLSFDPDVPVIIAVVLIAIKTYTTYPILLFCGRAAFDSLCVDLCRLSPVQIEAGERFRRIVMTIVWFVASVVLAIFIPNIGVVIAVLGAFAGVFIFIFPGLCFMQAVLRRPVMRYPQKLLIFWACAFVVLGMFIFGMTTSQAIMKDVKPGTIKPDKSKYTCQS